MTKSSSETITSDASSFSQSLLSVETILNRFKTEVLPLETAMSLFEAGITDIQKCMTYLNEAKGKVQLLTQALQAQVQASTLQDD
jgi:exodeoxyribonuclease VII small subunit